MYLGDKTGQLYPRERRARTEVEQWLAWQVANLGPMAGQAGHFRNYAREQVPYAITRYTDEVHRLFGVLDHRLDGRSYLAGDYSIADIATLPWARAAARLGQDLAEFPHVTRWISALEDRPAVARGLAAGKELSQRPVSLRDDDQAHAVLFGQRARPR